MSALDELATDFRDAKAAGYSNSIRNFGFIVTLVAVEHVLQSLVGLSKILQEKSCDLIEAVSETRVITRLLQVNSVQI